MYALKVFCFSISWMVFEIGRFTELQKSRPSPNYKELFVRSHWLGKVRVATHLAPSKKWISESFWSKKWVKSKQKVKKVSWIQTLAVVCSPPPRIFTFYSKLRFSKASAIDNIDYFLERKNVVHIARATSSYWRTYFSITIGNDVNARNRIASEKKHFLLTPQFFHVKWRRNKQSHF